MALKVLHPYENLMHYMYQEDGLMQVTGCFGFDNYLDPDVFQRAVHNLGQKYPTLQSCVVNVDGKNILTPSNVPIRVDILVGKYYVVDKVHEESQMVLSYGSSIRFLFITDPIKNTFDVIFTVNHVVADGVSMMLVTESLIYFINLELTGEVSPRIPVDTSYKLADEMLEGTDAVLQEVYPVLANSDYLIQRVYPVLTNSDYLIQRVYSGVSYCNRLIYYLVKVFYMLQFMMYGLLYSSKERLSDREHSLSWRKLHRDTIPNIARKHSVGIQKALVNLAARALWEHNLINNVFSVMIPVDLRRYFHEKYHKIFGTLVVVTLIPIKLSVDDDWNGIYAERNVYNPFKVFCTSAANFAWTPVSFLIRHVLKRCYSTIVVNNLGVHKIETGCLKINKCFWTGRHPGVGMVGVNLVTINDDSYISIEGPFDQEVTNKLLHSMLNDY